MIGRNAPHHVWWKPDAAYRHKLLIPAVEHGGRGQMIWACFTATGPGNFAVTEVTIDTPEVPCLTAKTWLNLSDVTRKGSQTQQQIYNRVAEKEKESIRCNETATVATWHTFGQIVSCLGRQEPSYHDKCILTGVDPCSLDMVRIYDGYTIMLSYYREGHETLAAAEEPY